MWLVIADDFSWQAWQHEGATRILPPRGFFSERKWGRLVRHPPADAEFLLVESVWEGFRPKDDRITHLAQIMDAFRRAGVPVVFRSKEDPPHFEKFVALAQHADVVLTTDSGCVSRYRDTGFRGIVEVLPFGVQPKIHRQYLPKNPAHRLFFAGTLRAKYPDRMEGYEAVIRPSLDFGLHIFSRKGSWPPEAAEHVVGSCPYLKLLRRYSSYAIGLNMSSVKHSPTMFPRRVVEMPLANVFVISDRCDAVARFFPEIPQSTNATRTKEMIQYFLSHETDRVATLAVIKDRLLAEFTCARQLQDIRDLLRLPTSSPVASNLMAVSDPALPRPWDTIPQRAADPTN